jgi:hypothetical protein
MLFNKESISTIENVNYLTLRAQHSVILFLFSEDGLNYTTSYIENGTGKSLRRFQDCKYESILVSFMFSTSE